MINVKHILTKIKNMIFKSDIIKSISTIASGSLIGYGLNTLLLPVLSRVFSPKQMGEYDLIISSASIYLGVLCLGMITAIMLPQKEEEARAICKTIFTSVVTGSTIGVIILVLIRGRYRLFEIEQNYVIACVLLYFYLVLYNAQSICYAYANRRKKYKALFWNPIIYTISNVGLSIIFGLMGLKTFGYMLGTVCGTFLTIFFLCLHTNPFSGEYSIQMVKDILKKYRSFPLIQMPSNFISILSTQFPTQFLGRMFGSTMLGGYTMACKVLSMPVSLLATPINNVYYRTAAEKIRKNEDAGGFAFKLIKVSINIAIIPIFILMVWGEAICAFFLGEEWRIAGSYMGILGIYYLMYFCNSCLSGTLILVDRKKINLISVIIKVLLNLAVFSLSAIMGWGLIKTIVVYTIEETLFQVVLMGISLYYIQYPIRKYFRFVFMYIFILLGSYMAVQMLGGKIL